MNNLAAAIYMTAEGIPFMQAGEEMLRTKIDSTGNFIENSYNSSDAVNSLKWDTLEDEKYQNVYNYYKGLIAFRKAHAALRLTNAKDVADNITSIDGLDENILAFQINGGVNGEVSDGLFLIFNPNPTETTVSLPDGSWDVYVNASTAGTEALSTLTGSATVEPISALVLVKSENAAPSTDDGTEQAAPSETDEAISTTGGISPAVVAIIVIAVVAVIGAAVFFLRKK